MMEPQRREQKDADATVAEEKQEPPADEPQEEAVSGTARHVEDEEMADTQALGMCVVWPGVRTVRKTDGLLC